MKKIGLIILFIWIGIIFMFSSEKGDYSKKTSIKAFSTGVSILEKFTNNKINYDDKYIESHIKIIRKCAHVFEYFILSILITILLSVLFPLKKYLYLTSIFISVLFASIDEFHQLFVPGRTGRVVDVFIDSIGIILGVLTCYFIHYLIEKIKLKKEVCYG